VSFIVGLYRRFADLAHELAKFGVIGVIAAVIDLGGAAALEGSGLLGPLTAKVVSTAAAATFSYAGNRLWTFRHRANNGLAREYFLFFVLNGIATLFAVLVIGFTEYTLHQHSHLAFNIAQVSGTVAGTVFRYWAYKKWVFLPPELPEVEPHTGLPIRPAADERPTAARPAPGQSAAGPGHRTAPGTWFGPEGQWPAGAAEEPRPSRDSSESGAGRSR
jgi:putative flippase GtrA